MRTSTTAGRSSGAAASAAAAGAGAGWVSPAAVRAAIASTAAYADRVRQRGHHTAAVR